MRKGHNAVHMDHQNRELAVINFLLDFLIEVAKAQSPATVASLRTFTEATLRSHADFESPYEEAMFLAAKRFEVALPE